MLKEIILAGTFLLNSGCATLYKTTSPDEIQPVTPIKKKIEKRITNYSKLTWKEAIEYVKSLDLITDELAKHCIPRDRISCIIVCPVPNVLTFNCR